MQVCVCGGWCKFPKYWYRRVDMFLRLWLCRKNSQTGTRQETRWRLSNFHQQPVNLDAKQHILCDELVVKVLLQREMFNVMQYEHLSRTIIRNHHKITNPTDFRLFTPPFQPVGSPSSCHLPSLKLLFHAVSVLNRVRRGEADVCSILNQRCWPDRDSPRGYTSSGALWEIRADRTRMVAHSQTPE